MFNRTATNGARPADTVSLFNAGEMVRCGMWQLERRAVALPRERLTRLWGGEESSRVHRRGRATATDTWSHHDVE